MQFFEGRDFNTVFFLINEFVLKKQVYQTRIYN
jgi:hypothetical protein